ncbi:MAG: NADH-quinone oxidoreductase subunit J [Halobacteria archaeon]|nr:NADH-quinone oxidoreductase subunit J [Halobacteria archaeon]
MRKSLKGLRQRFTRIRVLPALLVLGLFLMISRISLNAPFSEAAGMSPPVTTAIGEALFTKFLAPFEIIDVLLVAALIGGVYLAKRERMRETVRKAVEQEPRIEAKEAEETMGVSGDGSD